MEKGQTRRETKILRLLFTFFSFCFLFLSLSSCKRLHSRLRPYHAEESKERARTHARKPAPARIDVMLVPPQRGCGRAKRWRARAQFDCACVKEASTNQMRPKRRKSRALSFPEHHSLSLSHFNQVPPTSNSPNPKV